MLSLTKSLFYRHLHLYVLGAVLFSSNVHALTDKVVAEYSYTKDVNIIQALGHEKVGRSYEIRGQIYTPKVYQKYKEEGYASWYGSECDSKYTANGEIFSRRGLTAAHRTLPIPSIIKVTNLANNKVAILKLNDRGPFINTTPHAKHRILDVSKEAAHRLGFLRGGVARVRVELLPRETAKLRRALNTVRALKGFVVSKLGMRTRSSTSGDIGLVAIARTNVLTTLRDHFAKCSLRSCQNNNAQLVTMSYKTMPSSSRDNSLKL
jgi:rare lipoprotein A (peptidoglycan hydrolase)